MMDDQLTNEELEYLEISRAWLDLFLKLAVRQSNLMEWQLGGWTPDIMRTFLSTIAYAEDREFCPDFSGEVVPDREVFMPFQEVNINDLPKKTKKIKLLIHGEGTPGFCAINEKQKKVVSVLDLTQDPYLAKNNAYTNKWGEGYLDATELVFRGKYNQESFDEFEELFIRFVQTPDENINTFNQYLNGRYRNYSQ